MTVPAGITSGCETCTRPYQASHQSVTARRRKQRREGQSRTRWEARTERQRHHSAVSAECRASSVSVIKP
jgi:hypothetical protein